MGDKKEVINARNTRESSDEGPTTKKSIRKVKNPIGLGEVPSSMNSSQSNNLLRFLTQL